MLPCAIDSHPTPGDSRGSSSPSGSISGVSSHGADGGSARILHECVQPSLSRSSSPSPSIHSPKHQVNFHQSCSHHMPKVGEVSQTTLVLLPGHSVIVVTAHLTQLMSLTDSCLLIMQHLTESQRHLFDLCEGELQISF